MTPGDPAVQRAHRIRSVLVVLLAVNSGATDAMGFLAMGGAFSSVMTGNMVLLGLSASRLDGSAAAHTATALVCFVVGCAVGARLAGRARPDDPTWPRRITVALAVEFGLLLVTSVTWALADGNPTGDLQLWLLAISAIALGTQSSAVQRFGISGLSTTYLTGTLTTMVIAITSGQRLRDVRQSLSILVGLVGGAAASGLLVAHAPMAAPLLQLGSVGVVLLAAVLRRDLSAPLSPPATQARASAPA